MNRWAHQCDVCGLDATKLSEGEYAKMFRWVAPSWVRLVPKSRRHETWCYRCWRKAHPTAKVQWWGNPGKGKFTPDLHDVPPWRSEREWIDQIKRMEALYQAEPPGPHRKWLRSALAAMRRGYERRFKNPGYSHGAREFIGHKISKLAHEGYEAPQRVAIAMQMARRKGLKVPKRNPEVEDEHCYAVVDYGTKPIAGIRFMVQCLPDRPLDIPRGVRIMASRMTEQGARALADHLNEQARRGRAQIDVLKLPNPRFLRRGRHGAFFGVRRSNPTLAIMGANPPAAGDDIEATWAFLSYRRPDDPDGKRVVREHEFPDGFVAVPLRDGTILLKHPQGHNLWTRR